MKDLCAIYYGVIPMIVQVGEFHQEGLAILLAKTFPNNSIIIIN